jgi:hypothetical protein
MLIENKDNKYAYIMLISKFCYKKLNFSKFLLASSSYIHRQIQLRLYDLLKLSLFTSLHVFPQSIKEIPRSPCNDIKPKIIHDKYDLFINAYNLLKDFDYTVYPDTQIS